MKKFLLGILLSFFMAIPALCVDFMPKYKESLKYYGIGLYFGEGDAVVYTEPDDSSKVVAKLSWDADKVILNGKIVEPKNVFGVFLPDYALSGFVALDEQGTEYTKIVYDTLHGYSGWIKNLPDTKVYYWRQLFYKYGKTRGLYLFADTPKENKQLRLSPEDDADINSNFVYPKYIRLQLIKGNWALLKVVDYDNEQKVGWFRWRNSDGTLNMYPHFNGITY